MNVNAPSRSQPEPSKRPPEPRVWFSSTVPPTPGEQAAASAGWVRQGLLGRLIRR
jgi:hypothetical protein